MNQYLIRTLALASLVVGLGCSGSKEAPSQGQAIPQASPTQIKTTPANGAVDVSIQSDIRASFVRPVDPSTLTSEAFQVADQAGNRVLGTVSLKPCNTAASFTPLKALDPQQTYAVSISSQVKDSQGRPFGPVRAEFQTAKTSKSPNAVVISSDYTYLDNTMPGGPVYAYEDISSTGTELMSGWTDDDYQSFPIPFPVTFYGQTYTTGWMGSNGDLMFGNHDDEYDNYSFPDNDGVPRIALFWDDLWSDGEVGHFLYQIKGSAPNRRLIVQWHNISEYYGSVSPNEFQVIMYENKSDILFQYQIVDNFGGGDIAPIAFSGGRNNGGEATVGLNSGDGFSATQYSYNTPSLVNGRAILFTQPLSFTDDYGRSRLCITPSTGLFTWTILSGVNAGTSFGGTATVTYSVLGGDTIQRYYNKSGDPFSLNFSYNQTKNSAYGYAGKLRNIIGSTLYDRLTTDDPPGCFDSLPTEK